MASSKRDFKDFQSFEGKIEKNKIYKFPTLKQNDSFNRTRIWTVFVRLVVKTKKPLISNIDWEIKDEETQKIYQDYFIGKEFPQNLIAQVFVERGIEGGKITREAPTYITEGAFQGQANERNIFQQALIRARSMYEKKKDSGMGSKATATPNQKPYPMLAKTYKDAAKHIEYPVYVQPKLDGIRCITYLDDKSNPVMYSRKLKPFPTYQYIKNILKPFLEGFYYDKEDDRTEAEPYGSIYLDGEIYKHGKHLQDISGESRNEETSEESGNEYHLYDCFYLPMFDSWTFETRLEQLKVFKEAIDNDPKAKKYIKITPTILAKDQKAVQDLFKRFTGEGYEGIMIRNKQGLYLSSPISRSNDLVKMKAKETDEFEIVGFTEGLRGKDKGALIWQVKTKKGKVFNVTPKDMSQEQRKEKFQEFKKSFGFKGHMLTVEYESLSKDGIPQRAKAVAVRDYE